jgi:DNA-binding NarL/FixJ family response regulator
MATPVRLVIADDSESIRQTICAFLKPDASVAVVGEASSYAELVSKLDELKPDVTLMDMHMPGLNQLDSFKARLSCSCILAMSFWNDEETSELAGTFGAARLLDKSTLVSTLIPAIEECTRKKFVN